MTSRTLHSVLAIALGGLALAPAVWAGGTDAESSVKPMVLVLLDGSGSMEYSIGDVDAAEYSVPLCEEEGAAGPSLFEPGAFPKSRMVVAKEVLTGTINDYWCEYDERTDDQEEDFGYPVPHVQACSGTSGSCSSTLDQSFDGLVDVFRDEVKWVFMASDANPLVSSDAAGGFSYGDVSAGTGGSGNLGVRNKIWGSPNQANEWDRETGTWTFDDADRTFDNRGQLIDPPATDDFRAAREQVRNLQYEVLSARGLDGSPLTSMLVDARKFLLSDPAVLAHDDLTGEGDPYWSCRKRTAILITDGREDADLAIDYGYGTLSDAVEGLKSTGPTGTKVFVVGFNTRSDDSVLSDLDPDNGGPADGVFVADSPEELARAISEVLAQDLTTLKSRTGVVYTNATQSSMDLQYQLNASYQVDPDDGANLLGYLDQNVFRCDASCEGVASSGQSCVQEVYALHDRLDATPNDSRKLYTIIDGQVKDLDSGLTALGTSKAQMEALFGVPQSGELPAVAPAGFDEEGHPVPSTVALGDASDLDVQSEYLTQLIALVRADDGSMRQGSKLGAIRHATPAIQEPISEGTYPMRSWYDYVNYELGRDYPGECRPTVAYTGTHDGQIHAFRIDGLDVPTEACGDAVPAQDEDDIGKELWSITPHQALKKSHNLVGRYAFLMDGQPIVRDVLLTRGNPVEADVAVEAQEWRTVLTTGFGAGSRGYVALDVTHALDGPALFWEIDHEQRCTPSGCTLGSDEEESDYGLLGLTRPRPAYGTVFLQGSEQAVAFLSGGDSAEDQELGRALYVANLKTGEKIVEFSNAKGNVVDQAGNTITLEWPITGNPAPYSDVPGVVTSRVFVGDGGGRLFRIDMPAGEDPDDWVMVLFHDPYADGNSLNVSSDDARQPIFGAPALALGDGYGNLVAAFATGDIDYVAKSTSTRSGVVSVREDTDTTGEVSSEYLHTVEMPDDEKITGEPLIFNSTTYFTTYEVNSTDACLEGTGYLYGVHFTDPDPNDSSTGMPVLDEDGDPNTIDEVQRVSLGYSIPYGVQVIERPACRSDDGEGMGDGTHGGTTSKGDLDLVVNVAQGSDSSAKLAAPGVDSGSAKTRSMTHDLSSTGEMFQSASWGYVLY